MMKKTKRLGAVLLVLVMVLSMSTAAFAEDYLSSYDFEETGGGTIVIHKYEYDQDGVTLKLNGFADGTEKSGTAVVGTKEVDDGEGGTITQDVTLSELSVLPGIRFKLEEVELTTGGDKEEPDDYVAKSGGIESTLETSTTGTIGTLTWANLPAGVYRITEIENDTTDTPNNVEPFLVQLPFTDPTDTSRYLSTVHVYPKNTVTSPDINKEPMETVADGSGNVINAGSILGWKLTADIPKDIATAQSYVITDTPSTYLSYVVGSLKVYYIDDNGTEVDLDEDKGSGGDYALSTTGGKITVTLTTAGMTKLGDAIEDEEIATARKLYVEYSTKIDITEAQLKVLIEEGGNKLGNTAQVDFTNAAGYVYKPSSEGEETEVFGIKIAKVDKDGTAITSEDAKFKIYTTLNNAGTDVDPISIVADSNGVTEFTTDSSGYITVAGLASGTYYIAETKAPEGYNLLTGFVTLTISASGEATVDNGSTATYDAQAGLIGFSITNLKGFTLPQTGGMGTILFMVIGLAMIVAAGVCIVISRKKRNKESTNM